MVQDMKHHKMKTKMWRQEDIKQTGGALTPPPHPPGHSSYVKQNVQEILVLRFKH